MNNDIELGYYSDTEYSEEENLIKTEGWKIIKVGETHFCKLNESDDWSWIEGGHTLLLEKDGIYKRVVFHYSNLGFCPEYEEIYSSKEEAIVKANVGSLKGLATKEFEVEKLDVLGIGSDLPFKEQFDINREIIRNLKEHNIEVTKNHLSGLFTIKKVISNE